MNQFDDATRKFLNRRDWRAYVAAVQSVTGSPRLLDALKAGKAWFNQDHSNAPRSSDWAAGAVKT